MKINGVEVVGNEFAYDGCHKIYVIENEREKFEALDYEYEIYPIHELESKYIESCGLKFISNWTLDKSYVMQFEEGVRFE